MEFSLFEILAIFQKVDLISRFLAKIDIADFLMIATVLGVIYTKLNSGANKITNNLDKQINSLKDDSTKAFTTFKDDNTKAFTAFDKKIDDFKQESKERLTENTNSIKEMGIALKRNIDSDKLELKSDISSINQRVDTLNQTILLLTKN